VHSHQGELVCQFLEKTSTIIILVSIGSVLRLIYKEHKYTIKGTTARILKGVVSVQCLKIFHGIMVSFFKTLLLNVLNHCTLPILFKIRTVVPFILYLCSWHIKCRIEPIVTNVIIVDGFQGTGIVLPDEGARALERVAQSHQMYV
jgi:hypothetical protein